MPLFLLRLLLLPRTTERDRPFCEEWALEGRLVFGGNGALAQSRTVRLVGISRVKKSLAGIVQPWLNLKNYQKLKKKEHGSGDVERQTYEAECVLAEYAVLSLPSYGSLDLSLRVLVEEDVEGGAGLDE